MKLVFLNILLVISLISSCIEVEMAAPSFPQIANYFNVSESTVTLTVVYNLLAFFIASLIYGPLSEYYGRRPIMLIGNFILCFGAVGCVVAPSVDYLLLMRFIQGLGAATSAVVVFAIISDVYDTNKAISLYGIMNAIFTSLMAIAPIIGGIISKLIGWRGNYAAVAVICLISWILLFFYLPETRKRKEVLSFKEGFKSYKALLSSFRFLSAAIVPSLLYTSYIAFVALAPFLYMKTFGLNIVDYTLHQATIVSTFSLVSLVSGKVVYKLGSKKVIYLGILLSLVSPIIMLFITSKYLLTSTMAFYCAGFALLYPIIFAKSIELFPNMKAAASSLIMAIRYLLCSGITILITNNFNGHIISISLPITITSIVAVILIAMLLSNRVLDN